MSPFGKGGEKGHGDRRHTTGEKQGCLGALESRHLLTYERLIRIVAIPRIEELGRRLPRPSEKRSALHDRRNDGSPLHGFGRTGMDSDRCQTVPPPPLTHFPAHADPPLMWFPPARY